MRTNVVAPVSARRLGRYLRSHDTIPSGSGPEDLTVSTAVRRIPGWGPRGSGNIVTEHPQNTTAIVTGSRVDQPVDDLLQSVGVDHVGLGDDENVRVFCG